MSVEAMTAVLHHSTARGTAKVVLIGIANHEGDGGAWPALATLAKYANVTVRAVRLALAELERAGEISRDVNAGGTQATRDDCRPNLYHVLVTCPPGCDRTTAHRVAPDPREEAGFTAGGSQLPPAGGSQLPPNRHSEPSEELPPPLRGAPPRGGAADEPPTKPARPRRKPAEREPAPPGAQALIAEWIDHRKATGARTAPPDRVRGHVAREIAALLAEGHPYDLVRAALQTWDARRPALSPSLLANILDDVARGPAAAAPRPGSYDARLDAERRQADAIWAQPAPAPVEFPDDPAYADPIPPATPVPHPHADLPLF